MRGIEVHLNGGKLCTAGISFNAALNASVDIIGADAAYDVTLRVGGLENDDFVIWSERKLRVGDEISIRIVETKLMDAPVSRNPNAFSEP
jgi:hypothetical protein